MQKGLVLQMLKGFKELNFSFLSSILDLKNIQDFKEEE